MQGHPVKSLSPFVGLDVRWLLETQAAQFASRTALERFLSVVNREGLPNQCWGDSSCVLVKEAGMHGSSFVM